jgi:hypothetical protein
MAKTNTSTFTPSLGARIVKMAREGHAQVHCAERCGITHRTLMRWLQEDHPNYQPEFARDFREAEAEAADKLLKAAKKRDPLAILGRRWPEQWGRKREEHKPAAVAAPLSAEEELQRARAVIRAHEAVQAEERDEKGKGE